MEFKVFTLNCWGLVFVSKDRKQRMKAISEALANSHYDAVCLQEVWNNDDFDMMRKSLKNVLPYSHYFHSGVTGSGICIFSKHPIEDVFYHQWPVNGYIHKLHHGDWFGGKGVGLCRLKVGKFKVNVYSAHLHAEYNRDLDEYQAHRILQAFDTAQFIKATSGGSDVVILAGDLNTEPGDLPYRLLLAVPNLLDAFTEEHNVLPDNFATNECISNSYTSSSLVQKNFPGKRIDYILFHPGTNVKVVLKKYWMPLPNKIPGLDFSYSDHEAIASVLVVKGEEASRECMNRESKIATVEESIEICNEALRNLLIHRKFYSVLSAALLLLLICLFANNAPFGWKILYSLIKVCVSGLFFFTVIMATLWNNMERNGLLAGKLAMEIYLNSILPKVST